MATSLQAQSYEVVVLSQGGFEEGTLDLAKKLLGAVLKYNLMVMLVVVLWLLEMMLMMRLRAKDLARHRFTAILE